MIQRSADLRDALQGSMLAGREVVAVPVLDTGLFAFAVPIVSTEVEDAWKAARASLATTGLWPVASTFWDGQQRPFAEQVLEADFFSRFYFEEAPPRGGVDPGSLCERAARVDVSKFLDDQEAQAEDYCGLEGHFDHALKEVETRCGERPDAELARGALVDGKPIETLYQLERWLHGYEHARGFTADPEMGRQDWFTQDPCVLLFLPTSSGWESLAFLNWYGTSDFGSEYYIALGKRWEERFGAELVAHYGTMLQCLVSRPPTSLADAFPLAREHDLAGRDTLLLPGIRVRDYAEALIGWDRWFLHERP